MTRQTVDAHGRRRRHARRGVRAGAVASLLVALGAAPLALAQSPPASDAAPASDSGAAGWWLLLFIALVALAVVGAMLASARHRRSESALLLQARVSDALLRDPTLGKYPIIAIAEVPVSPWADGTLTLKGEVANTAVKEAARTLVEHEIDGAGAHIVLVDRIVVESRGMARAA